METATLLVVIRRVLSTQLTIRADAAYPTQLLKDGKRTAEGAAIFESFLPEIVDRIAGKIYGDLFGSLAGSPRMQAVRLQKFMEKHYAPLQPILGEERFRKSIDFPGKVDAWKQRQIPESQIQEFLAKNAAKMYWSAAQRDPRIMEREVSRILSAAFKNQALGSLVVEERLPALLQKMDLHRASLAIKDLFHDLHVFTGILYFVDKLTPSASPEKDVTDATKSNPINFLRNCIIQISQAFAYHPDFQKALA